MKITAAAVLAGLALAAPAAAAAQEELRVALPERHELVELQPGLQVLPGFDLEVFSTGGAYWLRSDGRWFQTRRPAATSIFTAADARAVPPALATLPEGSYLQYRPKAGQARSAKVLPKVPLPDPEPAAAPPAPVKAAPAPASAPAAQPAPKPAAKPAAKPAPAPAKKAPAPKK